jgi:hypothetical protein
MVPRRTDDHLCSAGRPRWPEVFCQRSSPINYMRVIGSDFGTLPTMKGEGRSIGDVGCPPGCECVPTRRSGNGKRSASGHSWRGLRSFIHACGMVMKVARVFGLVKCFAGSGILERHGSPERRELCGSCTVECQKTYVEVPMGRVARGGSETNKRATRLPHLTCKRCNGVMPLLSTISRFRDEPGYQIFCCVACSFTEWVEVR